MLAPPKRIGRMLPRNWPRQVRSAVVHAISMSNVVFTVTRSHGENHFNARVRMSAMAWLEQSFNESVLQFVGQRFENRKLYCLDGADAGRAHRV